MVWFENRVDILVWCTQDCSSADNRFIRQRGTELCLRRFYSKYWSPFCWHIARNELYNTDVDSGLYIMDNDYGFLSLLKINGRNVYVIFTHYKLMYQIVNLFSSVIFTRRTFIISMNRYIAINCIDITIAYPITYS